jgi:predicted nucleic acid-binding protein
MELIDTSVFVAYFNKDDELHEKALGKDYSDGATNSLVLCEVANVLEKRLRNKELAVHCLKQMMEKVKLVALPEEQIMETIDAFSKHYGKLSFTDCSLLVQAKNLKAELITFDEKLAKAT